MSTSDQQITLTVTGANESGRFEVYDGYDQLVGEGRGTQRVILMLPRGLYTLRTLLDGVMGERVIRLTETTATYAPVPESYSAAPLASRSTSHEYYSDPARDLSRRTTRGPIGGPGLTDSAILLFLRAPHKEVYRGDDLRTGLSLRSLDGEVLSSLADDDVEQSREFGRCGLSAAASPGTYLLQYDGDPPRVVPIQLFPGWRTLVFIMHHGSPLFGSMRVFMTRVDAPFETNDPVNDAVDRGLLALQNPNAPFPRATIQPLLEGSFDNPMLGIVGAALLMQREARDANLLDHVFDRLMSIVPDAHDVHALVFAHVVACESADAVNGIDTPPMLRASMQAAVDADAVRPEAIVDNSLAERVVQNMYADSPWTSWAPFEAPMEGWIAQSVLDVATSLLRTGEPLDFAQLQQQTAYATRLPVRYVERATRFVAELGSRSVDVNLQVGASNLQVRMPLRQMWGAVRALGNRLLGMRREERAGLSKDRVVAEIQQAFARSGVTVTSSTLAIEDQRPASTNS